MKFLYYDVVNPRCDVMVGSGWARGRWQVSGVR